MSNLESRLNPQVVELLGKIRSGEYLRSVKVKFIQLKWVFLGIAVLLALILAVIIGRRLSQKSAPVYVPPIIDISTPTTEVQKTSAFDSLKRSLQLFSPQLPDPAIPAFDNNLNLEKINN
jgi:hypothetical protein